MLQELERKYTKGNLSGGIDFNPRELLNSYNASSPSSRVFSTWPMKVRVFGRDIDPHWIDWNAEDVYLQDHKGDRLDFLLNPEDLLDVSIERTSASDKQSQCAECFWHRLRVRDPQETNDQICMLFDSKTTVQLRNRVLSKVKDLNIDFSSLSHYSSSPEARVLLRKFSEASMSTHKVSTTRPLYSAAFGNVGEATNTDSTNSNASSTNNTIREKPPYQPALPLTRELGGRQVRVFCYSLSCLVAL